MLSAVIHVLPTQSAESLRLGLRSEDSCIARYKETPARRDDARRLDLDAQDRSRTMRVYAYHDLSALFPSKTSALWSDDGVGS